MYLKNGDEKMGILIIATQRPAGRSCQWSVVAAKDASGTRVPVARTALGDRRRSDKARLRLLVRIRAASRYLCTRHYTSILFLDPAE